ncbi:LutC/YkgG family protein [Dictyobacter arantiisoli]|uniref:Lactate utilization protein C n=1 Tax=Dictyobacter arantiisoli TaxID=2014874 RepID=A0A5A5T859_9CHLR|nr:LUD domain-containing protein [Dictyobacter arantiisoli]GCF07537.1 lactate utilization protein C [Dictyobacter arantiisoli]
MSESVKAIMLARIRQAIAAAPEPEPVQPDFQVHDERDVATIRADFTQNLLDYKASVINTTAAELSRQIAELCLQERIQRLVLPVDVPVSWLPAHIQALRDDPPLALRDLDACDAVLTGCAVAIARTGTIILDGGERQGRRILSLVPDRHLCVVYASQIVGLVPEAIAAIQERAGHPITLISGPSATSDIELSRVEGVHGPRSLSVLIVQDR